MSQEIVLIDETGFADVGVRRHFCQFGVAEWRTHSDAVCCHAAVSISARAGAHLNFGRRRTTDPQLSPHRVH